MLLAQHERGGGIDQSLVDIAKLPFLWDMPVELQ
jgi:hypothetical protein